MTRKNRKILLICIAVIISSYVVRSVVTGLRQMAYYREQALRAAQQRAKPKPGKPAPLPPAVPPKPAAPLATANAVKAATPASPALLGAWRGRAPIDGLGLCYLRLVLKPADAVADGYTGFTNLGCLAVPSLMSPSDRKQKTALMSSMGPDAAILSGTMKDGAIHLEAQKNIGADIHGCRVTSLTLTPFGINQLAAEWQEGTCQGGRMILGRK